MFPSHVSTCCCRCQPGDGALPFPLLHDLSPRTLHDAAGNDAPRSANGVWSATANGALLAWGDVAAYSDAHAAAHPELQLRQQNLHADEYGDKLVAEAAKYDFVLTSSEAQAVALRAAGLKRAAAMGTGVDLALLAPVAAAGPAGGAAAEQKAREAFIGTAANAVIHADHSRLVADLRGHGTTKTTSAKQAEKKEEEQQEQQQQQEEEEERKPEAFVVFSGGPLSLAHGQDIVLEVFRRFQAAHPEALLLATWHNAYTAEYANLGAHRLTKGAAPPGRLSAPGSSTSGISMGDGMWMGRLHWDHFLLHNKVWRGVRTTHRYYMMHCSPLTD